MHRIGSGGCWEKRNLGPEYLGVLTAYGWMGMCLSTYPISRESPVLDYRDPLQPLFCWLSLALLLPPSCEPDKSVSWIQLGQAAFHFLPRQGRFLLATSSKIFFTSFYLFSLAPKNPKGRLCHSWVKSVLQEVASGWEGERDPEAATLVLKAPHPKQRTPQSQILQDIFPFQLEIWIQTRSENIWV